MRNVKAKNSLIVERGAKKTLKVFKPLVASSLALALGVSVGNADPTLTNTTNGGDTVVQPDTTNGNIWITSSDGYYQLGNGGANKKIWFSNLSTPNTPYYQYKDTNMNELHIGGSIISSVLNSDKGIKIGDGNGTLTISMWLTGTGTPTPRTFTLDLGSVDTTYALYGNLVLDETGGNSAQSQFYGNFGGSGISGKLTLKNAGTSTLNFTQTISSIGGGIRAEGTNVGTTSINAQDLTITNGGGDAVGVKGGTLNITATNLKLNRNRSDDNGTGLWGTGNAQINITLNDGGSLSVYRQNESTLGRVVLDANTQFALTLKGNATIKASFTGAYSSSGNTRTFNFGDTTSSGAHTVTFQGEFTSSKGEGSDNTTDSNNIGIASIFNFQNDGFTFAFKNANEEFQGITFDNTRNNAINFNANGSVFDLGENALTITGTLGINLGAVSSGSATSTRTETTGTINTSSIASSGTTTITFNTDNSTLNLKADRSGAINVSGGTTTINFTKSGAIGGAVNTSGGNTIINIADEDAADISSGVNTSGGTTDINFNGANGVLVGAVSTSGGTTTIKVADTKSGTINGAVTTTSGDTNINFATESTGAKTLTLGASGNSITGITFGSNGTETSTNNKIILSQGDTSITNVVDIKTGQGLTFDLGGSVNLTLTGHLTNAGESAINFNGNNGTLTGNVSTTAGTTSINFKGENGILAGEVNTSDSGSTTINIADSSSGTINGNVSTPSGSTTLATIVFASGNGGKSLRLGGNDNTLASITLGTTSASTNNTLTLSGDRTVISNNTTIASGNGLSIVFENTDIMLRNSITNSGTTDINFNGGNGLLSGNITTTGSGAVTTINISDGNSGTIDEAITTASDGITNINFAEGGNAKSLTLSADGNTLSGITLGSNSTANTLALSTGSTSFANTINVEGNQALTFDLANNTTLTFSNDLSNIGGNALFNVKNSATSTIVGNILNNGGTNNVTIGENGTLTLRGTTNQLTEVSSNTNGILSLDGNGSTGGVSASVSNAITGNSTTLDFNGTTGKKAELTLNNANGESTLKALTLTASASAVGDNVLNLNANKTTITDNLSIASGQGMTINLVGNSVELASGITNQGATNLNFNGSAGTLTGAVSTTAGTTTISVANGKSGSITGAITTTDSGATTTINFANGDEAKSLTLGQDTNTLTNITFGNGILTSSSNNTLTLTGDTAIKDTTTIGTSQDLTFDLVNNNINLENIVSNTGGSTILNYNGNNGTLTGSVSTSGGTTALNFNQSGRITQGVSTSGGATTISIGNTKTATINASGVTTSGGTTTINFDRESTLAGNISTTTSGTTTFNLGSSNSSTALATISGTITNSATNIFNVNATTTTLKNGNGLVFSGGTNTINFANADGATLNWQNSNGDTQDISTRDGTTNINFNNDGVITGGINTDGGTSTTNIKIANGKSGTIDGSVAGNGSTIINFDTTSTDEKTLTLNAGGNSIRNITFGNGTEASTNNKIVLNNGRTEIRENTHINSNQGLTFNLAEDSVELVSGITNQGTTNLNFNGSNGLLTGTISTSNNGTTTISVANGKSGTISGEVTTDSGATTTINFAEGSGEKSLTLGASGNTITGITLGNNSTANTLALSTGTTTISTNTAITTGQALTFDLKDSVNLTNAISNTGGSANLEFNGYGGILTGAIDTSNNGTTTIQIADSKYGTITGAISTTGGITNINFLDGDSSKSLNLQGSDNQITTITSGGSGNNTLSLDTALNGMSADVSNAIVGDNLTISMGGTTSKATELTLNNIGGDSTLKALILTSTSAVGENVLNLNANKTTITDDLSIDSSRGLTINLADSTELASEVTNQGATKLNFNGSDGLLTGTISTSNNGTTTISIANGRSGTISGAVTTAEGNGTTTIDFAEGSGEKSLTLSAGGNTLSGITLGTSSTANTLILNSGKTEITGNVSVASNQGLTFNLAGDSVELDSNISNENITNLNFNGSDGLLTGTISTDGANAATTIAIADNKSGTISGAISTTGGAITTINFADGSNAKSLNLQGTNNQITTITSGGSGNNTLSLDTALNGVSTEVSNAISGADNLTIALGGKTDRIASLILNNTDGNSTIKALNLSANSSAVGENVLSLDANKTTITDNLSIDSDKGLTINLDNAELASGITNSGSAIINFNGTTSSKLTGNISTNGSSKTTTFNVANSGKGFVNGNITLSEGGANNVTIGNGGTLTLQGANNQLTSVSSDTSGILSLDGNGSTGGVEASVSSAITGNTTTLNFNGATGKKAELTLSDDGNELQAITLGSGATNNKLILSQGSTSIQSTTNIAENQALSFDLKNGVNLTNEIGNTGGTTNLEFNGTNGILTGTISTSNNGTTTITIADNKSGTITGAVTTSGGATNIDFADGSNAKSLNLQGTNNQITTITSDGSENTLTLDTTRNGVSAEVSNAISGADNLTITLGGKTDKIVNLTLNNTDGNSTIKALTFGSGATNNIITLSQNNTSITDYVSLISGQGATFNLNNNSNLAFAKNIANTSSLESLVFNIKGANTISGDITTGDGTSTEGITKLNVVDSSSGIIVGNIFTRDNNATNITIGNGGTLTLQGENNQLTSVSSTTSGTLKLDGTSNANGVSASVSNAIENSTTTLNFNGTTGKKAEMTLASGDNALKAVTLGSGATNNTLILSQGTTSVNDIVSVGTSQALAFDLANGTTLTFSNDLSNTGGEALFNVKNSASSTIVGSILNDGGTNNVTIGENGTLTLQGVENKLTNVSSTTSGTLKLDGANNGVNASVKNAIAKNDSDSATIVVNFNGKDSTNIAELTLEAGNNYLKGITLGDGASATTNNKLILSQGSTSVNDAVSVDTSQALAFDLADGTTLTFTNHFANSGGNALFNVNNSATSTIVGNILNTSGTNNVTIGENGTLTLRGTTNQLTEVSSTISGILSLDGASNENGVSASVSSAITGNTTTLNFNGSTDKKAEMTLRDSGNKLKAITLGGNSTANTLTLSQGSTGITDTTTIAENQALTFDLKDSVNLTNNISNAGITNLEFNGSDGILTGTLSTTAGTTTISIANDKSGTITGVISTTDGATTTINFADGSNAKSLNLQGANNAITTITSGGSNNALNLDTTSNGVNAKVSNAIAGDNLTISMGGTTLDGTSKVTELTLNNIGGDSTLKTLTLTGTTSAVGDNVLNLNANKTTISDSSGISIGSGKGLTINLADSTELVSGVTNQGATNLNFNGSAGTLTGAVSTTDGATTIKIADGKSGTISGAVTTTDGTTNISFAEGSNKKSLTLGSGGNTITGIVLGSNPSTNNILALNNGATTISNAVNVERSQALAFDLANDTSLTFNSGLTTAESGTTTFNLGSNDASATTTTLVGTIANNGTNTFNVNSATTTLKYDSGLAFSSGVNEINFTNTNGATLNWRNTSDETNQAITTSGGTTQINFTNNGTISGGVSTSDSGSTALAISNGRIATIDGISTSGGNTQINFNGESGTLASAISTTGGTTSINISDNAVATITGNITTETIPSGNKARVMRVEDAPAPTPAKNPATNIAFNSTKTGEKLSKSTLILQGSTNQITTLTMGAGENILALMQNGDKQEYTDRNATIENLDNTANGKLRLVSQISTNDANTFTINDATFSTSKEAEVSQDDTQQNVPKLTGHISLILSDGVDTNQVGKESAILVASVKDGIGVAFEETSEFADGFLIKEATFTTNDDEGYTNYYLGSITTRGIANSEQKAIASAFMLDYNLYMANLNSLNRRMGELRENAHSQGVWARVFNGGLSNEFGLGSKSNYTTIQAGYDYAFGSEGANNYLGFALSYALSFATSDSKATDSATGEVVGLDNIYSNAVEIALYNSYVSDSGWYNDTIAKFSYIMSSFDIQAGGVSESRASDTKNYALTLSNEVGYAIRFGEMSEWSITPQVEATFGYFSQSDFKQNLSDNSQYLDSKAESVLTLRARAGSAFTYDFRAFTQKSGFNASLYVGAFYEYDYVNGGDISMVVSDGTTETQKSDIGSDGRVVMNVGTNMTIQDNTRLYFDFEKSFMGKINTDYQVNFGVRYSFGESDGYTPILEKSDYKAPLKVEGEESKKEDKEVKEGKEKQGEDKVKEGEKKEKTQKSKDKGSKSVSKESKNTKALDKAQSKEKPSK